MLDGLLALQAGSTADLYEEKVVPNALCERLRSGTTAARKGLRDGHYPPAKIPDHFRGYAFGLGTQLAPHLRFNAMADRIHCSPYLGAQVAW